MAWTEKFVTATASGGGSGNSEGDAYTFSEMMTANHAISGWRYNVKAGTYNITSVVNHSATGNVSTTPWSMRGYTTTPGDLDNIDQRTLTGGTDIPEFVISGGGGLTFDEDHAVVENIAWDSQNGSALNFYAEDVSFNNCRWKFNARTTNGMSTGINNVFFNCSWLLDGTTSSDAIIVPNQKSKFLGCDFKQINGDSDTRAIENADLGAIINCVFDGVGHGIYGHPIVVDRCTFHNCSAAGIEYFDNANYNADLKMVSNCIFSNMPIGIENRSTVTNTNITTVNNLYHLVTSPRSGYDDLNSNFGETVTSTDPFTDSSNGDFTLTSTSPALASNFTSTQAAYLANNDIGAIQSAGSGGGGGGGTPTTWSIHPLRGSR